MRLVDRYDGSQDAFEGDRTLWWRSLPANVKVTKATVTVVVAVPTGGTKFEEAIAFTNGQGDFGATKATGTDFVEVDFHGRRTLAAVTGTNLTGANLQVELGGVYIEINNKGAVKSPGDALFTVPSDGKLPGLTVNKFKLTGANVDISSVTVRSVPTNVSVRLGQMPPFWTRLGELATEDTSPEFAAVLQAFLAGAKVENGFYIVPLVVHSDTLARVKVDLEVEYLSQAGVLPEGLKEVVLPFDFSTLPKMEAGVLKVALPANARVVPRETTTRVIGAFDEFRIVYGPTGAVTPVAIASLSPTDSQAQVISLNSALAAMAVDLLVTVVSRTARLGLDLRGDSDGKPDGASLLPASVEFRVDGNVAKQPTWVSVSLPSEFHFADKTKERYWVVVQSLEGEAAWSVQQAPAGALTMQHTVDGGLSWRDTTASGVAGPLASFFRLRRKPDRFQVPIELQVGTGDQATRVKLDRFQPTGRVDFALDFPEVAEAFNQYLAKATPASCPETEHLANGDFEQWLRVGETLMPPTSLNLNAQPEAVAVAPDGSWAYVASSDPSSKQGLLQVIDVACDEKVQDVAMTGLVPPATLVISPDGTWAFVADSQNLRVIDTGIHQPLGVPVGLQGGTKALALSPDGGFLYLAEYFYVSPDFAGTVRVFDAAKLEQAIRGQITLGKAIIATHSFGLGQEPTALVAAPDGSALYVVIIDHDNIDQGGVYLLDAATLQPSGNPIPVEKAPRGIALSTDGKVAVVANKGDNTVSVIDTAAQAVVGSINVGNTPVAVALSPEATQAYVVNQQDHTLSIIDLARRVVTKTVPVDPPKTPVGTSPVALALTPQGDRIYIASSGSNSLSSIQVGTRLPAEWNLTSGWVTPFCLPDPFHLIAVLGQTQERVKIEERKVAAMPSALSQTVPVAESCPYEFSFWGIATEPDAVAEVLWLGPDCGLRRTDQVPIEVLERQTKAATRLAFIRAKGTVAERPRLMLHRVRLLAPAGANQAEVRFGVPTGVVAGIDRVSLTATTEAVANADFALQQDSQLADWTLLPGVTPSVSLLAAEEGIQLRNASADTVELVQTVPVRGDQPFALEFQGRTVKRSPTQANSRLELRWLKADGSSAESPTILEILFTGFESSLANGTTPAETTQVEVHLVVPAGTTQEVKRVSLRSEEPVSVPVTFVAQAPGELRVSDARVAYDQAKVSPPPVPDKGLCTPTPPDRKPGEPPCDRCFCPCCEVERTLKEPMPMITTAGRPALVGSCPTCDADLVLAGGRLVTGLQPLSLRRLPVGPRFLHPAPLGIDAVSIPPLTALAGIGEGRVRQLATVGITSIEGLAAAAPEVVARALKGVSLKNAAGFVERAKRLLTFAKKP